ncbi:hypothetical protein NM688_g8691 [Phlebia brevispora]|uniref:Uncharacterized protein n=1 Tax=Phlebia brevispora TaxID=194682 RepID=A0ACC1RQY9_9APHY|nr:hypothetical protein NM688_g8691 [Phlebia brevispora]
MTAVTWNTTLSAPPSFLNSAPAAGTKHVCPSVQLTSRRRDIIIMFPYAQAHDFFECGLTETERAGFVYSHVYSHVTKLGCSEVLTHRATTFYLAASLVMGQPEEVDVIVCGGGPAGCVVAGRLAYADPNLKVMLIEGGANNRDDPWVYRPGIYVRNMQRNGINDKATFYTDTMESSYLRGRRSIVPCANILGGGSSINFQMYTRASASDWDDFKTEGWTAKDLLPLMKRLENYQKPCNNDTHGYDGPIAISNGGQITPVAQDFLRASHAIGVPFSDDIQDLDTAHGAEIWAKYVNRHTGRRSDAATAYVHSVMDVQSNLYLRTNARVSRVLFDANNKAVGVAYVPAKGRTHNNEIQETVVKARKMVVLSSGTLGTPQILERSGVGNGDLLRQLGVKVVSDLPGVGEEYQDHYTTLTLYRVSNETVTTDDFLRGVKEVQKELFAEWETSPEKARLSSNFIDAGFKIRPTAEELKEMGPEFNELWNRYFKDKPDKPVMFGSIVSGAYADHALLPPGNYITMFQYLEYPASRGKVSTFALRTHMSSPSSTLAS